MHNKQFAIIMVILVIALGISVPAFLIVPKEKEEVSISKMPMKIGEWQGKDLSVDERAYEILETRNLILREYTKGNDKVYLYAIYSQGNRKVSHPPEVCFEGSGVTIIKKEKISMELVSGQKIPVNELVVEKDGANNIVIYWYKAEDFYTDNYLKQQLRIALLRLRFKDASGAMIRVSAEVPPAQSSRALENIRAFTKEASRYFEEVMP